MANGDANCGKKWQKDTRLWQREASVREKHKYYCQCGHSVVIPYNKDKKMCTWCKHWIIKKNIDERRYFIDKMRQMLNRREE